MAATTYLALRDQVQGLLAEGQTQARRATQRERVETYWSIGDALLSHIAARPRAGYGEQVVASLGKDPNLSPSLLWDTLRRLLPILHARGVLAWTHYRRLTSLPTQDQFRFYERLADREGLTVRQLEKAIRADLFTEATTRPLAVRPDQDPHGDAAPLRARFGPLYIYRVVPSREPGSDRLCLDIGFHMTARSDLAGLDAPRAGQLVTSRRHPDGDYTFRPVSPNTRRYTYVSWIDRNIDGDTFVGAADPGLGLQACDLRFRLRGIDTLELHTLAGRNARAFVTAALGQASFVVVRTHKTDSFGRYLADLRYLPGESDPEVVRARGICLNRQLLDERLARRYLA